MEGVQRQGTGPPTGGARLREAPGYARAVGYAKNGRATGGPVEQRKRGPTTKGPAAGARPATRGGSGYGSKPGCTRRSSYTRRPSDGGRSGYGSRGPGGKALRAGVGLHPTK